MSRQSRLPHHPGMSQPPGLCALHLRQPQSSAPELYTVRTGADLYLSALYVCLGRFC
jgi:hypothetical protein